MTLSSIQFSSQQLDPLPAIVDEQRPGEAAVLVPLVVDEATGDFSLLLTLRSARLNHHAGEVAFPGGMWEPGDHFPTATALREAEEEVALVPAAVRLQGVLPALLAGRGMTQVVPVVATLPSGLELQANPDEIASIFHLPIAELIRDERLRTDIFPTRGGLSLWAPAYSYQGYEIWGFTAAVIKLLLQRCFGVVLQREHSAPEKIW